MSWSLTGPWVALVVPLILLIDRTRRRLHFEGDGERLFRDYLLVATLLHLLALNWEILGSTANHIIAIVYNLVILVNLYLWLLFILEQFFNELIQVKLIVKFIRGFLLLVIIATLITLPFTDFSLMMVRNHVLPIFTLIWVTVPLSLLKRKREHLAPNRKRLTLVVPLLSVLAIALYISTTRHYIVSLTFTITLLLTYISVLNDRLSIDPLTLAKQRHRFVKELNSFLTKEGEHKVVIIADLCDFKFFNQKYGLSNGDLLLSSVGRFFITLVGRKNLYRYGGDQFALIYNPQDGEELTRLLTVIEQRFASAWEVSGACIKVDIKLAILKFSKGELNSASMIDAIDLTLSKAKEDKFSNITYYSANIAQRYERQLGIEAALHHAVDNDTIKVVYQPIVDAQTRAVETLEALARIDDFHFGPISPVEFIPVAEATGLINDIAFSVVKAVCRLWKELDKLDHTINTIAINLSPTNFTLPNMEKRLLAIIRQYEVDPGKIKFELTESLLVHSYQQAKESMEYLAYHGIKFALDDFGVGFSNLESLVQLPFDTVKIDRSIIKAAREEFTYFESIVLMLKRMGKAIVAEGIEDEELASFVSGSEVDYLQGFHFSRPLPPEAIIEYLQEHSNG